MCHLSARSSKLPNRLRPPYPPGVFDLFLDKIVSVPYRLYPHHWRCRAADTLSEPSKFLSVSLPGSSMLANCTVPTSAIELYVGVSLANECSDCQGVPSGVRIILGLLQYAPDPIRLAWLSPDNLYVQCPLGW